MVRFISYLFGLKYEPCKGCEVMRQQLEMANKEKQDLLNTLLDIMKPKVEIQYQELKTINAEPKFRTFTARRQHLENQSKIRAEAERSNLAARPDAAQISKLEEEVGLKEDASENGKAV